MTRATWRKLICALRAAVVQQHVAVRLQRRQRRGELGDVGGDQPDRGRGRRVRGARLSVASPSATSASQHGGHIPLHETHEVGLDVDVRPIRTSEDQCRWGVNYRWSTYDRKATRALIKDIIATAPGHITDLYFNDPVLIREGLTTWFAGHDDHIHVRYCEKTHPRPQVRLLASAARSGCAPPRLVASPARAAGSRRRAPASSRPRRTRPARRSRR